MATEIRMPRLGWTMEEGIFGEWLKADGDAVKPGDFLFTIEGDKATQEVEAFDAGVLRLPPNAAQPGDVIVVGAPLPTLRPPVKAFQAQIPPANLALPRRSSRNRWRHLMAPPLTHHASPIPKHAPHSPRSPRARRVAGELKIDWTQLTGSGRTGRIVERDVRAAAALATAASVTAVQPAAPTPPEEKVRATPVAMRMAQEAGRDLAQMAAQKPGARIERADVEAAIAAQEPTALPAAAEHIPHSNIRRLTAQRMAESAHTAAAVTLTTEVDATALVALRAELKQVLTPRAVAAPSYNDLFVKLTASALSQHPLLNARWQEEEIIVSKAIHIGLAVDTAVGLVVPVLRDVATQSLLQIAEASKSLIAAAHARKLDATALQGGTFTITNLGMYNIDAFTPIINPPQCAILGIGRIVKKPAVVDDRVDVRELVTLSLTFDHRVVDGGPAARSRYDSQLCRNTGVVVGWVLIIAVWSEACCFSTQSWYLHAK
ncbi:MAG: 2-oxo acid dehydrogenase subunit E2 [Caldilineaceae bacterium]